MIVFVLGAQFQLFCDFVLHTGSVPQGHRSSPDAGCKEAMFRLLRRQYINRNYLCRFRPVQYLMVAAFLFLHKYHIGLVWIVQASDIYSSQHRWTESRLVI
jgi:hypothetical protein